MTSLSTNRKIGPLTDALRPSFLGIPIFVVVMLFLFWSLARLGSWVFVVLRVNK